MADRLLSLSVTNCHDRVVSVYTVCCLKTVPRYGIRVDDAKYII